MLDIKFVREHPDEVQKNIDFRGGKVTASEVLEIDKKRRDLIVEIEAIRAKRNRRPGEKPDAVEMDELKKQRLKLKDLEAEFAVTEKTFEDKLSRLPNMSSPDMPKGRGDADHVELCAWIPKTGYLSKDQLGTGFHSSQFMPQKSGKHHVDLGKELDVIDIEQSALVSGSRFAYIKGDLVLLQYALFDLLKKKLLTEGFIPMSVPILVKERALFGTSHFPEGRDQVYQINTEFVEDKQPLYLVGSSEPPLFAYYMDKVLEEKNLPVKMFAVSSCFRSEVGSWGKDVRGIKRVHQFDKLEMDTLTVPEKSREMMEYLRGINEWFMQQLQLPYRVINKCSGDCGYSATFLQYDWEGWLPAQKEFIELGTDTDASDYQARRLNIQCKTLDGKRKLVHTVNDTGCSTRMLIAIIDNYQNTDGSVTIPEVLRTYMGKDKILPGA